MSRCGLRFGRDESCLDNIGGIKNIYIINYDKLPYEDMTIVDGELVSINGLTPLAFKFEVFSTQNVLEEVPEGTRDIGSVSFLSTLNLYLHKLRGVDMETMYHIAIGRLKVIVEYNNGVNQLLGSEFGMTTSVSSISGGYLGDFQGWNLISRGSERYMNPYIDNIEDLGFVIITDDTATPIITTSRSSLYDFSYQEGYGPSASKFYFVNATKLQDDLEITSSAYYEISLDNITFSSSITLPESGGNVPTTTIYVRLKAGYLEVNSPFYGAINNESLNANVRTVNLEGVVTEFIVVYNFEIEADWMANSVTDEASFINFMDNAQDGSGVTVTDFVLDGDWVRCNLSNSDASGLYLTSYGVSEIISIGEWSSLIELDLGGNSLTGFNPSIALPSSLIGLYLYSNQLTEFNPSIELPSSLTDLYLHSNQLTEFNPSIELPSSLATLFLHTNQLTEFNPSIALPSSLTTLNLYSNQLTTTSYTNAETWANAQPSFTSNCYISFTNNTDSITGTNLETILLTKNVTIYA